MIGNSIGLPPGALLKIKNITFPEFEASFSVQDINHILAGEVFTLNCDRQDIKDFESRWKNVFCGDVNFSSENIDIRSVLEPSRLQHLTYLTLCNKKQPDNPKCGEIENFIRTALFGWITENPFLIGPHYISTLECALRIHAFAFCLCNIKLSPEKKGILLNTIYQHAWWVDKRYSLYPAPGNHAIGESLGLLIAGLIFEEIPEGTKWVQKSSQVLKAEVFRQIKSDGGPLEGSIYYHFFLVDLFCLAFKLLELNKNEYHSEVKKCLRLADRFLSNFNITNTFEHFNDSDNGYAVAPGIFIKRDFTNNRSKAFNHFPESGYTKVEIKNSWKLLLDHAPLGMPPLYSHGHADALSIVLSYKGEQFLIDPGTYRYFGTKACRDYFRSTRAHNTIEIDGKDQAEQVDNFIWDRPYACHCNILNNHGRYVINSQHTGYKRLKEKVIHKRIIELDVRKVRILDQFSGKGDHVFRMHLHIHPDAQIETCNGYYNISKNGTSVYIYFDNGTSRSIEYYQASQVPFLGWCAPCYGRLSQCHTLRITKIGRPQDIVFETIILRNE